MHMRQARHFSCESSTTPLSTAIPHSAMKPTEAGTDRYSRVTASPITPPIDIVARMIAPGLSERLGQQILVDKKLDSLVTVRNSIDINPGATIGERFFIDHGTGIVIGETSEDTGIDGLTDAQEQSALAAGAGARGRLG